jgi:hypothetical protein
MENIVVFPRKDFSKEELKTLIESRGGKWSDSEGIDQGVIMHGDAVVYISYVSAIDKNWQEYPADELDELTVKLGVRPLQAISIHIGHAAGSSELASAFSDEIVGDWGGIVEPG